MTEARTERNGTKRNLGRFMTAGLLVASTALGLGLAEVVLRIVDPTPYLARGTVVGVKHPNVPSDYLPSTIGPYLSLRQTTPFFDVIYRANGEGFRDNEELPTAKPPGEYRVLLCGDSFTLGYGVHFSETYGEFAEAELNRDQRARYRMINGGYRTGYTVSHYLAFLRHESSRWDPDHVVVQIYLDNDFVDLKDDIWEEIDGNGLPTRIRTRRRYTDFAGRFIDPNHYDPYLPVYLRRSRSALVVARLLSGRYKQEDVISEGEVERRFRAVIVAIVEHCRENDRALTWIVIPPLFRTTEAQRTYVRTLEAIQSAGERAALIDFNRVLDTLGQDRRRYYIRGDAHLNPEGNRLIGNELAEKIGADSR